MTIFSLVRPALGLVALAALVACGGPRTDEALNPVTRNAPELDSIEAAAMPADTVFSVVEVRVEVPRSLEVSEANRYYPGGDIVWRGDPPGDRHQQVADILLAGLTAGAEELDGAQPVIVKATVTRFHALTEKARYVTGGVHAIQFGLTLYDPETGEPLGPTRLIVADFKALGGQDAIEAEQQGITQKTRIVDHLAKVLQQELATETGYQREDTGLLGALNQL